MSLNKDLFVKIISIMSLVVLGYIFFISVYNQIIVQSGGVFYVIIFGGILILAFVLLSLVTKLIEITKEINDNKMWNFVEGLLLCILSYLFLVFRMSYKSTVPGEETILYRAAALMSEGALAEKGMDMVKNLIIFPSQYVYAFILSVFFKIGGVKTGTMVALNAFTLILTAFLIDRVVRKVAGRACGLIAALCTVLIPSQSFAVYSYSSEAFFCAILLLNIDLWLILLYAGDDMDDKKQMILSGVFAFTLAFLCFIEPLMILCAIAFIVYYAIMQKNEDKKPKMRILIMTGGAIVFLILLLFIKTVSLGSEFGTVISGSMSRFKVGTDVDTSEKYSAGEVFKKFHENLDNQNTNVTDNSHFLVNDDGESYTQTQNAWLSLGTQMSYMFVIVMSIACAYYMFRNKRDKAVPLFIILAVNFIILFFRSTDEASTFFLFELLIITACCGLNYMYMNHHPELYGLVPADGAMPGAASGESTSIGSTMEWGSIAKARKLIFVKNDEENMAMPDNANNFGQADGSMPDVLSPDTANDGMPAEADVNEQAPSNGSGPDYVGGSVSPEGYFSFFDLSPTPAPSRAYAPSKPAEPEPEPEYTEEYDGPVEEVNEAEMDDFAGAYEASSYDDGAYEEPVYEEPEYEEPVYEEPEYEEPAYEDSAYEEPSYEEQPVYEEASYDDNVTDYNGEATDEYTEENYEESYDEPSFDELATEYDRNEYSETEYTEPAFEEPVYEEPAYEEPVYTSSTKKSYGSAAHALGFSLDDSFFDSVSTQDVYEEKPAEDYPAEEYQEAGPVEEYVQDQPEEEYAAEASYEDETGYDSAYDAGIDEFSFGEGMPDIDLYSEPEVYDEPEAAVYDEPVTAAPAYEEPVPVPAQAPAPAPKKKVVKKVVKRVVKKAQAPKPVQARVDIMPEMPYKADLSSIEAQFAREDDYVDYDAIYDEPEGGEDGSGFVIEI